MHSTYDCLIVGAGIAAAAAARRLSREGLSVAILEKSTRPGGRMASAPLGGAFLDYGAQHLTIRDPHFRAALESLNQPDLLRPWFEHDGETRHFPPLGMRSLPERLLDGIEIFYGRRAVNLSAAEDHWRIGADSGEIFSAHSFVLTAPLPQSLAIAATLDNPAALLPLRELAAIPYHRCLALLAELEGPSSIPDPGHAISLTPSIHFAADCARKGLSQPGPTQGLVLLANPSFSLAHWDDSNDAVAEALLAEAAPHLGSPLRQWRLKRWRYSHPARVHPRLLAGLDHPLPGVLAGDAFGGPRVEGAFCSGRAAAEWILTR